MEQRIDWMSTGKEYWEGHQEKIKRFINGVDWKELPCTMAFCQGEAIKETIKANEWEFTEDGKLF